MNLPHLAKQVVARRADHGLSGNRTAFLMTCSTQRGIIRGPRPVFSLHATSGPQFPADGGSPPPDA
jgi:hypothetical protein